MFTINIFKSIHLKIQYIVNQIKHFIQLSKLYNYYKKTKSDNLNILNKTDGHSNTMPLTLQEFRLLSLHTDISITHPVAKDYRWNVKNKNNLLDTDKEIIKKLVRNMVLGKMVDVDANCHEFYDYGNLQICYDAYNRVIIGIDNRKGKYEFNVDLEKKAWCDNFLELDRQD